MLYSPRAVREFTVINKQRCYQRTGSTANEADMVMQPEDLAQSSPQQAFE